MAGRIVHISDRAEARALRDTLPYYPANQTEGSEWIIESQSDLADYCAFNNHADVETTIRRAIWEASLQLQQVQA